jgi:hypothetical protein
MIKKAIFSSAIREFVKAMALLAICSTTVTGAEAPGSLADREDDGTQPAYLTVTKHNRLCVVRRQGLEDILFGSADPRQAVEWALKHSRIAILTGGEFSVTHLEASRNRTRIRRAVCRR